MIYPPDVSRIIEITEHNNITMQRKKWNLNIDFRLYGQTPEMMKIMRYD